MAKTIVKDADVKVGTYLSKKVHSMLKSQAAHQGASLRDYFEAGMILVLNKTEKEVRRILEDFAERNN